MADVKQQQQHQHQHQHQHQQRPGHRRNQSSKSGILRSLVSAKSRPASPEPTITNVRQDSKTTTVPSLPPDTKAAKVLGERQGNVQSPPSSPSRKKGTLGKKSEDGKVKGNKDAAKPVRSKSSTNLSAMFAKMNRSSKDVSKIDSQQKDKENASPMEPNAQPMQRVETPIWAQFASDSGSGSSRLQGRPGSKSSTNLQEEIDRYTPTDYSPSKQRNFNGSFDAPSLRPTLGKSRPQSAYYGNAEGIIGAIGRRVSGDKKSFEGRKSEDSGRRFFQGSNSRVSMERDRILGRDTTDRKASGSSAEHVLGKEKLDVKKRGGRVMAAVAALQGKNKETDKPKEKDEAPLDPKEVDAQFEAVLDSRNIPEPMRQKMRSLTMRVKADFIKQDQGSTKSNSPPGSLSSLEKSKSTNKLTETTKVETKKGDEEDGKSTKRSRTRSRAFTFTRGRKEERGDESQSRSRPNSLVIPDDRPMSNDRTPTTPTVSWGRKNTAPALPADYITYLRKNRDPTKVEVGRLHKLRILLRNETVAWVDAFVSQDGMLEIVGLLNQTMALEWREDHEDQLLHETLLCLKGLCTTERAMLELTKLAQDLFPALLGMLFDEEKKGPAEYSTRTIIVNLLFNYLSTMTKASPTELEERARTILQYLGEPRKPQDAQPVDFVSAMRVARPYKLWSREVSNVTKEVFWIFLHHLNVVSLPKPSSSHSQAAGQDDAERKNVLAATYTTRHFPGSRPPVPAAPYIGGVEWDATTYLTAHLDLLNGLVASIPDAAVRNVLREELRASGFEKVMGNVLRTCKEKFYSGVHDALRAYVAAAHEDGWDTRYVREGPSEEQIADEAMKQQKSPKKSPKKKGDLPPKLDALPTMESPPKLDLGLSMKKRNNDDDGWLG
ncbi:hypothetical protein AC579_4050 [Pseudocercospora musae]|uniref:Formin GTPase-binding domain-containing protein n=1 Tax=Pseudocercospora musae TaxID=113226 RepID=A0A139IDX5_9PEZI|nr:hypothetical protein AC579_4050 [Pseudocercospora musae]